jgi:GNAT superfamily N-acetyltransferase
VTTTPAEPAIRLALPEDALEIAGVHVRSWQVGYRGLIDSAFLDALDPAWRAGLYGLGSSGPGARETIIVTFGEAIAGFSTFGPTRDPDAAGAGEIYALYVDPPHWGAGLGRSLLEDSRRRLLTRGFTDAVLWVLLGNVRAERFYREDGWRRDGAERDEDPYGVVVRVRRFRRRLA